MVDGLVSLVFSLEFEKLGDHVVVGTVVHPKLHEDSKDAVEHA